jgi:hypothetical protein
MEVSYTVYEAFDNLLCNFLPARPREHHAHAVLHWIKAAFKKHTLDSLTEADCFNKEAYRQVLFHIQS